ncbi:RNA polymerase sigma-70 factor [Chitinophaga arvensicola]|uniref:RNA polymerase sigma factor n=1 Tax=Chitinophaga arvensicola TaxID=29529 RepID=A0A1I0S6X6_9BACT|nr:RNA polymerase sigma-70 factor [Chitinophaga arvensicola]SEW51492.1 RNA polymerase sigma-70 factor, ECF subfamily [Chitinophaga arvensicola]
MEKYTDEELLQLLMQNDEPAFRQLYKRYWKKLLTKAYTQLQSHADAEELVQDVFINIWHRRHSLQIKYSFHTYIAAVTRYKIFEKLAGKKRLPVTEDAADCIVADRSTELWLDGESLKAEIESVVGTLPEKCQLVFRLSREQGLTEKQIAHTLQISHKTVESHMSKALRILRGAVGHLRCLFCSL